MGKVYSGVAQRSGIWSMHERWDEGLLGGADRTACAHGRSGRGGAVKRPNMDRHTECGDTAPARLVGELGPLRCRLALDRDGRHSGDHRARATMPNIGKAVFSWKQKRGTKVTYSEGPPVVDLRGRRPEPVSHWADAQDVGLCLSALVDRARPEDAPLPVHVGVRSEP